MPRTKNSQTKSRRSKYKVDRSSLSARGERPDIPLDMHAGKIILSRFFPTSDEFSKGIEELERLIAKDEYSTKELKFIAAYLDDPNGTKAAIEAGYSPHSAKAIASELIKKDRIRFRLAYELARIYQGSIVGVVERKEILSRIARADIFDFANEKDGRIIIDASLAAKGKARGAVKKIKTEEIPTREGTIVRTELEMHDAKDAIDKLNRMDKVYEDKLNLRMSVVEVNPEDQGL